MHVTRVVAAAGHRGQLGAGQPRRRVVPRAVGPPRGPHDLRRGLVLDLNPVATTQARRRARGRRRLELRRVASRVRHEPALGHHAEPDDERHRESRFLAGRVRRRAVQFDPRQALFFPEKRPFFLDGIEQFATPNNLIYTRRVVAPIAAAKLTGKVDGRTNLAYLAAVDDASLSATGEDHPVFNILRAAAGRRRQVEGGARLHRSHRRRLVRIA